jgi:hypothetical protein
MHLPSRAAQGQVFLQPGDLLRMTGQGQLSFSFDGVGQAQHRQRHARLQPMLRMAFSALLPVGQEHRVELLLLGQFGDTHLAPRK